MKASSAHRPEKKLKARNTSRRVKELNVKNKIMTKEPKRNTDECIFVL